MLDNSFDGAPHGEPTLTEEAALSAEETLSDDAYVRDLEARIRHLEHALDSRIIIEQAKGVVSVRCDVDVDLAFELIRRRARSHRRKLYEVCAEIVASRGTLPWLTARARVTNHRAKAR
jgi:hypothetical protein